MGNSIGQRKKEDNKKDRKDDKPDRKDDKPPADREDDANGPARARARNGAAKKASSSFVCW